MFPDTLKSRLFATLLCFTVIALTFFAPSGETSPVVQAFQDPGYCMADGGASVVYFSAIYDTKLQHPARMSTTVIAREFLEYLKGRYDFTPTGSFPSSCPRLGNISAAEASKREFEVRARQANKQVIETEWKYVVDEEYVTASYSHPDEDVVAIAERKRPHTHTYCVSDSSQGPLYTAGPVDTGTGVNLSFWNRGFDQLLRQKYSYKGQVYCNVGSSVGIGRLLAARVAGARAAGRKIVDTGWKYDASVVATNHPPQPDSDPEPVKQPAAPNPSRQASDLAAKEMPESVAFCKKDPAMSLIFICDSFGRAVYNYRMAHLNEAPEPVATLVASNKVQCIECVDPTRVSSWVENHAVTDKLSPKATNCASQQVIVNLQKTPEPKRLTEFYKQAIATCGR